MKFRHVYVLFLLQNKENVIRSMKVSSEFTNLFSHSLTNYKFVHFDLDPLLIDCLVCFSFCRPISGNSDPGIQENFADKIRNPGFWNPEYSSRNSESH